MRIAGWCALVVCAGCFSPSFDSGKLQCAPPPNECPPGFECHSGLCYDSSTLDLGVPDAGDSDLAGGGGADLASGGTLATGTPCGMGVQCVTGFCADGVCCDSPCDGVCVACNLVNSVGNCSPVPHGNTSATLGHPACTAGAASTCGDDGTCDGAGACAKWPQGTVCQPSVCNGGMLTPTSTCDGAGACVTPTQLSCTPFQCQDTTQCWATCTVANQATQCQSPATCVGNSCGTKANGLPCGGNGECTSTHCADGVCCDGACTGTCEKCSLGTALGVCTAVSGAAAHGSCAGFGTTCGSACNGSNRTTCVFTGSGTACNDGQSCTYNDVCDGAGMCAGTTITPTCTSRNTTCASYSCNGTATCASAFNASPCDDGNLCTYNDACNGAGTCVGTAVTCPSKNTCHTWACNGTASCTDTGFQPAGTMCGTCHCGQVNCNASGSCSVNSGCVPPANQCP